MTPIIELENLEVRYGPVEALRGISFEVSEGTICALVGGNGAGKSTTLKSIMGLLEPCGGTIRFAGEPLPADPVQVVRGGIALSPEGRRLFPHMSVHENLLMGAYAHKDRSRRRDTLEMVYQHFPRLHERHSQLASSLSGGEQQMVAIGRALMAQPQVLLLDEPSLGLAPRLVSEIAHIIADINHEQCLTVLLVEQNAHLALKLAHRAHVIENGSIVLSDSGAALLNNPHVQQAYLGI